MTDDDQSDARFSLVYLTTAEGLPDSKRARIRVAHFLEKFKVPDHELAEAVEGTLGVRMPFGYESYLVDNFIEASQLRDFLDLISIVVRLLDGPTARQRWIFGCRSIFGEIAPWLFSLSPLMVGPRSLGN